MPPFDNEPICSLNIILFCLNRLVIAFPFKFKFDYSFNKGSNKHFQDGAFKSQWH